MYVVLDGHTLYKYINNEIVPVTNLNKYVYNDENGIEMNVSNINEKIAIKPLRLSES
jgi:hypothetical protein